MRPARRGAAFGAIVAILLVSLNLRPAIVAVGPLADSIGADTGLRSSAISLLTTLPLICLGVFSATATPLARRFGLQRTLLVAIVVILAGTALRLARPDVALFLGSAVAGTGIALGNVLVPALVKRDFPGRTGMMMGLYNGSLQAGAALASGLTLPLRSALRIGWRPALALWGVLAVVAVLAWLAPARESNELQRASARRYAMRRSRFALSCAAFIGTTSGIFYSLSAWMPSLLESHGMAGDEAGIMLSIVAAVGIVGGLGLPLLATRLARQWPLVLVVAGAFLVGLVGLLVDPVHLAVVWAAALGLGQGGGLGLATTLFNLRSRTPDGAAQLSGLAQTGGYLVAAAGPFAIGALHDATGGWSAPMVVLIVALAPLSYFGCAVSRHRFIEDEASPVR